MKKVLVLEDESSIRGFLVINLKRSGYEPIEAASGEEAFEQLRLHPDIKVGLLDVMLPDTDGFEVCRKIRASGNKMGIIMLTARSQEMDKVTGLMTGADDYVTKPLASIAELTARVDALYRRVRGAGRQWGDRPGRLPPEHPQPHPGEKRQPHPPDPGGICHHPPVHGKSRQGPEPGGDPQHRMGPGS